MRLIARIALLVIFSAVLSPIVGVSAATIASVGMGSAVILAVSGLGSGIILNDTIAIGPIADELRQYVKLKDGLPEQWFYYSELTIRKYARQITRVMGKYRTPTAVFDHILQAFKAEWTPMGKLHLKSRDIENSHLKFNVLIKVHEILAYYKADLMYNEQQGLATRPIAQYIMSELETLSLHDLEILSLDGVKDPDIQNEAFGFSMDGIITILLRELANTIAGSTDHPYFVIPANDELTENDPSAIMDEVRMFERRLPRRFRTKIDTIFLSRFYFDEYMDQYRATHSNDPSFKDGDMMRTYGGRKLVPLESEKMEGHIMATMNGNILDMIDRNDRPRIHDIQTQDYDVKVLGEGRAGFDFGVNQAVFVRSEDTDKLGLHNAAQNKLYFDINEVSSGSAS